MKILHLISGGDTGGAKTHVLSLLKELNKYIDAEIICFIEDEFYYEGKDMGIPIEVFKQKNRFDMTIVKRLKQKIVNNNYDLIHCHGARANFISMFLRNSVNKPFITTIHSDYKLDFKDNIYKRLIFTTINSLCLKFFDYYIAVSKSFRNMLIDRGFNKDRIFTVYNGISFNNKIEIIPKEEFLRKYDICFEEKIIIGIVARLDLVKNHEVFINAAKQVLQTSNDVLFLIAGSGPEKQRLISLINEYKIDKNVHLLGYVNQPYSFFNAIDINVLTSNSESFPYVVLEGARLKKPIVSTNVGGLSDLIINDNNGYLFDIGDSSMLSKYLIKMINNKDKTKQMGENLYNKVKTEFSLKKMALDHCDIYKNILENGGIDIENN